MVFNELLQVSLGTRERMTRVPDIVEWQSIFIEVKKQAVVGVFAEGIDRLPPDQRPPKQLLLQWIALLQNIEGQYYLHLQRAKELTDLLVKYAMASSVLKGIGIAQYYPNPSRRQCGDIDIWVSGERQIIMTLLTKDYSQGVNVWHHTDVNFFDDVETEIHFHPGWLYNPFDNNKLQKWFNEQQDSQMKIDDSLGFAYPTVQFNAVYSLVHSYHHLIEEGLGLRHIIDYYYILMNLPTEEKDSVVFLLNEFRLIRLAAAVMWILEKVCGIDTSFLLCEPNEKDGRFLLDEVMRGGNFGRYRKDMRKRNTASRMLALLPYYSREVLWVVPWKLWHRCWRVKNR